MTIVRLIFQVGKLRCGHIISNGRAGNATQDCLAAQLSLKH